jgi:hypothetical protein
MGINDNLEEYLKSEASLRVSDADSRVGCTDQVLIEQSRFIIVQRLLILSRYKHM